MNLFSLKNISWHKYYRIRYVLMQMITLQFNSCVDKFLITRIRTRDIFQNLLSDHKEDHILHSLYFSVFLIFPYSYFQSTSFLYHDRCYDISLYFVVLYIGGYYWRYQSVVMLIFTIWGKIYMVLRYLWAY